MALVTIWKISWKSRWFPALFTYVILHALVSGFCIWFFGETDDLKSIQLSATAGLIPIIAFILFMKLKTEPLYKWAKLSGIIVAMGVIYQAFMHLAFRGTSQTIQVPFFSNPSLTGTFIALACFEVTGLAWWVATAGVFLTGAFTPALLWVLFNIKRVKLWMAPLLITGIACVVIRKGTLIDSGRKMIWQTLYTFWENQNWPHYYFGLGFGSSQVWLPKLQFTQAIAEAQAKGINFVPPVGAYVWAHQDHLQILAELGLVGAVLYVIALVTLFRIASPKSRLFLVGFGLAMMSGFPLHLAPHALLLWIVLKHETLKEDEDVTT
jgi:hypothetical protein